MVLHRARPRTVVESQRLVPVVVASYLVVEPECARGGGLGTRAVPFQVEEQREHLMGTGVVPRLVREACGKCDRLERELLRLGALTLPAQREDPHQCVDRPRVQPAVGFQATDHREARAGRLLRQRPVAECALGLGEVDHQERGQLVIAGELLAARDQGLLEEHLRVGVSPHRLAVDAQVVERARKELLGERTALLDDPVRAVSSARSRRWCARLRGAQSAALISTRATVGWSLPKTFSAATSASSAYREATSSSPRSARFVEAERKVAMSDGWAAGRTRPLQCQALLEQWSRLGAAMLAGEEHREAADALGELDVVALLDRLLCRQSLAQQLLGLLRLAEDAMPACPASPTPWRRATGRPPVRCALGRGSGPVTRRPRRVRPAACAGGPRRGATPGPPCRRRNRPTAAWRSLAARSRSTWRVLRATRRPARTLPAAARRPSGCSASSLSSRSAPWCSSSRTGRSSPSARSGLAYLKRSTRKSVICRASLARRSACSWALCAWVVSRFDSRRAAFSNSANSTAAIATSTTPTAATAVVVGWRCSQRRIRIHRLGRRAVIPAQVAHVCRGRAGRHRRSDSVGAGSGSIAVRHTVSRSQLTAVLQARSAGGLPSRMRRRVSSTESPRERIPQGEHLVQRDAERIDVLAHARESGSSRRTARAEGRAAIRAAWSSRSAPGRPRCAPARSRRGAPARR